METKFIIRDIKFGLYFTGDVNEHWSIHGKNRINEFEDDFDFSKKFEKYEDAENEIKTFDKYGTFEIVKIFIVI